MTREARLGWSEQGVRLVGIDAANIDDMTDGTRPAHTLLLQAEIPIVEHLTGLDAVPPTGARFFAVPPKVEGFGTFPVRAFAQVPRRRSPAMPDDMVIETERTMLRPWRPDEADRVLDIYSRWEVSRWLGAEPKVMESREEAENAIVRFKERRDEA